MDDSVGQVFAELVVDARRKGRHPRVVDALIAATALVNEIPIYT